MLSARNIAMYLLPAGSLTQAALWVPHPCWLPGVCACPALPAAGSDLKPDSYLRLLLASSVDKPLLTVAWRLWAPLSEPYMGVRFQTLTTLIVGSACLAVSKFQSHEGVLPN